VFVTRGIADKDELQQKEILDRVRAFDLFTSENDPYAEHDFGSFEQAATTYMSGYCEPVSAPNSLLTGKLTGNFAESGPPLRF
jgi:Protein of unknown function (DUF3768)